MLRRAVIIIMSPPLVAQIKACPLVRPRPQGTKNLPPPSDFVEPVAIRQHLPPTGNPDCPALQQLHRFPIVFITIRKKAAPDPPQ